MGLLVYLFEVLYGVFCRHQWVRDRHKNGRLAMRCMKCMKVKDDAMVRLIEWQPHYKPINPAYQAAFPPPLEEQDEESQPTWPRYATR